MESAKLLESVLMKLIVPKYNLVGVKVKTFGGTWQMFDVVYFHKKDKDISVSLARKLTDETVSLWEMLSLSKNADITVWFNKK